MSPGPILGQGRKWVKQFKFSWSFWNHGLLKLSAHELLNGIYTYILNQHQFFAHFWAGEPIFGSSRMWVMQVKIFLDFWRYPNYWLSNST